jgi:hypothetical protein
MLILVFGRCPCFSRIEFQGLQMSVPPRVAAVGNGNFVVGVVVCCGCSLYFLFNDAFSISSCLFNDAFSISSCIVLIYWMTFGDEWEGMRKGTDVDWFAVQSPKFAWKHRENMSRWPVFEPSFEPYSLVQIRSVRVWANLLGLIKCGGWGKLLHGLATSQLTRRALWNFPLCDMTPYSFVGSYHCLRRKLLPKCSGPNASTLKMEVAGFLIMSVKFYRTA